MLYEVFAGDGEDAVDSALHLKADVIDMTGDTVAVIDSGNSSINHRIMFTLAIATSIDAMAAGFTLNLLALNAWLACLIIALVTAGFGLFGVYLGWRSGTWLEDKAEALGGLVLIAIGLKIMFFA